MLFAGGESQLFLGAVIDRGSTSIIHVAAGPGLAIPQIERTEGTHFHAIPFGNICEDYNLETFENILADFLLNA